MRSRGDSCAEARETDHPLRFAKLFFGSGLRSKRPEGSREAIFSNGRSVFNSPRLLELTPRSTEIVQHVGNEQLRHHSKKIVVERLRTITVQVVVGIPKFGSVGPH